MQSGRKTKRASRNIGAVDRSGGKPHHDSRSDKEKQEAPEEPQKASQA